MNISEEMLNVIKSSHKYTNKPWTNRFGNSYIGYGHKINDKSPLSLNRPKADKLLEKDIKKIISNLNKYLKSDIPQNHFDVMCSLAYDIGWTAFRNSLFFNYYLKGLHEKAFQRIMSWSYIKDELSLAMKYRRAIDYQILTTNDYDIKRIK